ncbi:MAG TPA: CBS domain-containing protein [Polyangiaceae bacterium]|nr:CBS domain-containing protein [Polyangiaceae bacterium]
MTKRLVSVNAGDTVREAAREMREADVGSIVVLQDGRLHGILTDRDIVVRCIAEGGDCDETHVAEICSPQVATLRPEDRLQYAVELMRDKAIRRIPVVRDGVPVGILSLGDLALERDPNSALGSISAAAPNN